MGVRRSEGMKSGQGGETAPYSPPPLTNAVPGASLGSYLGLGTRICIKQDPQGLTGCWNLPRHALSPHLC